MLSRTDLAGSRFASRTASTADRRRRAAAGPDLAADSLDHADVLVPSHHGFIDGLDAAVAPGVRWEKALPNRREVWSMHTLTAQ